MNENKVESALIIPVPDHEPENPRYIVRVKLEGHNRDQYVSSYHSRTGYKYSVDNPRQYTYRAASAHYWRLMQSAGIIGGTANA